MNQNTNLEVSRKVQALKKLKKMLAFPDAWIQCQWSGHISPDCPYPTVFIPTKKHPENCWCLKGAIETVSMELNDFEVENEINNDICELLNLEYHSEIMSWNDNRDRVHADIVKFIDKLLYQTQGIVT